MANFYQRIGHFQNAIKGFSKEQTQPVQEANCSPHMKGAEDFEISDFLVLEDDAADQSCNFKTDTFEPSIQRDYARAFRSNAPCTQGIPLDHKSNVIQTHEPQDTNTINPEGSRKRKAERALKYAFLTRSETDILQDGYKWRKYGRKFLKNSPNPRNYYRCSDSNCNVKKTVERDAHDKEVVITTYLGNHNHESPTVIYYIGMPEMHQASASTPNYQLGNGDFFRSL